MLALDYDGTIARGDRLDPSVLDAIAMARTRGITVGTRDGPHSERTTPGRRRFPFC